MPRSPLTEIINKVSALAEQIHALPEDERNYLLDLLLPEQEAAPAKPKRKRKKVASTSATSRRGLPAAQQSSCIGFILTDGNRVPCNAPWDDAIHDENRGYAGYHPFVAPTTVPRARGQSSRNGEEQLSVASSETSTDVATSASGG